MSHSSLPIYSMYECAPTLQIGTPKVKKYQKMQFTVHSHIKWISVPNNKRLF